MRPEKTTVDYYPHFCAEEGKTLFILESTFGNDGYTFWFKLLSLLGRSPGHFYDVSERNAWLFVMAKSRVSEETADRIMETLAELKAIDRDLWRSDRVIWCQNFVDGLKEVYKRRTTELPQKPSLRTHETNKCIQKHTETMVDDNKKPQSRVDKSIVDENINNNNSKETSHAETACAEQEPEPAKPSKVYPQEAHSLFETFRELVAANDPAYNFRKWDSHLDQMDKLMKIDKRDPIEINRVMVAALTDPFWKSNLFSVRKFREKYPQLRAKMLNGRGNKPETRHDSNMAAIRSVLADAQEEDGGNHGEPYDHNQIAGDDGDHPSGQNDHGGVREDLPEHHGSDTGRSVF